MELDPGFATGFACQRNSTHCPGAVTARNERWTGLVNRWRLRNRRRRCVHGRTRDLDARHMAHEVFEPRAGGVNFV